MGDRIEITTWPRQRRCFYMFTGSGLSFEVKAPGNAVVALARKPGPKVDYWIAIGDNDNHRCWIRNNDGRHTSEQIRNILSSEHYNKFWLLWNKRTIQLGREGEQKPLVTFPKKIPDLKYVAFGLLDELNPVHWRFNLPPCRKTAPLFKPISCGQLTWVEAGDQLPDGALIGGFEKDVLYIIRARHQGSLTPGKFVPSEAGGYIPWGGAAHGKGEFDVLCGFDCAWVPAYEDRIPAGAFVGGFSEVRQERLYVGRAVHDGQLIPGKVQLSHKCCYIPYDGREIGKKNFEVLVEPIDERCMNETRSVSEDSEPDDDTDNNDDLEWGMAL